MTDDLISRKAAVSTLTQLAVCGSARQTHTFAKASNAIELLPTVDAVLIVHAQWEEYPDARHMRCTSCKIEYERERMPIWANYCPHCGAKMDAAEAK